MRQELQPWQTEGTWAPHRSPWLGWSRGFSDSPGANYEHNADSSLTSGPLSLAGVREPRLEFREHHTLESGYDHLRVEVQNVADGQWRELDRLTGSNFVSKRSYDLGAYAGKTVRVRLRLTSDGSGSAAGIDTGALRIVGKGVSFTPEQQSRRTLEQLEQLPPDQVLAVRDLSGRVGGVTSALALWPDLQEHLGQPDYAARRDALVSLSQQSARAAWPALESAPATQIKSGLAHVGGLVAELGPAGAELLPTLGPAASETERQKLIELARREGVKTAAQAWPTLTPGQAGLQDRLELRELARLGSWEVGQLTALGLSAAERTHLKTVLEAPAGWRPEGTWTRTARGWDDSPGADYKNGADSSLHLPVLDLNDRSQSKLVFRESHKLESGYDSVSLEGSRDGQTWTRLESWTGHAWPRKREVDLSAYDGGPLHLRFRLQSDSSGTASGFRVGQLTLKSKQGSETVEDRSADMHRRLFGLLTPAPDRASRLELMAQATTRLGSSEEALGLWDASAQGSGADLVRLAGTLGSRWASAVWPSLQGLPQAQRQGAMTCLEGLRKKHSSADVARLWGALAPVAARPDFESLRTSLVELAEREGVAAAVRRFGSLAGTGAATVERSVQLHDLAQTLAPRDAEALWQKLKSSSVDAQVLAQLDAHVQDWRPEGTWARVRPASWAWREVWQDSPGGDYQPHANMALTTPPISLAGLKTARAQFWSAYSLENGYDQVRIEASNDGGQSWKELQSHTGSGMRARREVNLDSYAGQNIHLRFRLTSDGSGQKSGISLGQLKVVGDRRSFVVDPRAAETRAALARLAVEVPQELPELLAVAEKAGGTRNAVLLWERVKGADPDRRATAARLAATVGVESALESWDAISTCPPGQLPGVVEAARACPNGWSLLVPDLAEPDLAERAAALSRLVDHLGEEKALERWPSLRDGSVGTLADRVEAEELAARLQGRVRGLDRDRLASSGLGARGTDALRSLVGPRQQTSLEAEDTWARVRSPWWGFQEVWQDSPGASYLANANSSLTSAPVSLAQLSEPVLRFSEHHRLESHYDEVHVEITSDGKSWKKLDSITGKNFISRHKLDLSAYEGERVQVRFRLCSDSSGQEAGISLRAPRIEARDEKGSRVVLHLDSQPLEDVTPLVELALDSRFTGSQRTSYLELMAELNPAQRSTLLEFCAAHPHVSVAQAMNALLAFRLTADLNDPNWMTQALASLPDLVASEQAIGETAQNVTIGGVVIKKKRSETGS